MQSQKDEFRLAAILQNIFDEMQKVRNMTPLELNEFISETQFQVELLKARESFNWIKIIFWENNEAIERRTEKIRNLELILNFAINQRPIFAPIAYK